MNRFKRFLFFGLTAALGALAAAGLAELIWSFVPEPKPVEQVDCQPTVMLLSLDKSYSMVEDGSPSLAKVREAVQQFVTGAKTDECLAKKQFGLVTFNQQASLDVSLGQDLDQFDGVIAGLNPVLGDSTIIEEGVNKAVEALATGTSDAKKVLFLLTDAENYGSDGDKLQAALEQAVANGIDVHTVITNEGPHAEIFRSVLGASNVQKTDEAGMGNSFFAQARALVLSNPVIAQDKALPPLYSYLFTGLWTGLVAAGIVLALLIFLNIYNKRRRILSAREGLTLLFSLVLGFAIGTVTQYLFSIDSIKQVFPVQGNFFQTHAINFLIWTLIGLLLALSLAGFKVLPNLKLLNTLFFGVLGGLVAGLCYSLALEAFQGSSVRFLPSLIGAVSLGLAIGLVLALLTETSAQFPIWLRVYYTSDKVYRYHPIGKMPISLGSSREADIYVQGDHPKLWEFWVEDAKVQVKNFVSGQTRGLSFKEIVARGAIELKGMIIKIVDDKGPEKGKMTTDVET